MNIFNMARDDYSFHEKFVTAVAGLTLLGMIVKILFF
jgi:hypothetical protein